GWACCSPGSCSCSCSGCAGWRRPRGWRSRRGPWRAPRRSRGWCRPWRGRCSAPTSCPSRSRASCCSPRSSAPSCSPSGSSDAPRAVAGSVGRAVRAGGRRRAAAAQRHRHLHVRRADAQCREPDVRRAGPAARRGGSDLRLLRDGRRGGRGGRRARDHARDLPPPADGQSTEHQPAQGLMPAPPLSLLWVVPALPLAGFVVNGALALTRPTAKRAVSIVGVGTLVLAFAAAALAVAELARQHATAPLVFRGWEGVGLCSYLLIGFWFNEQINSDAGKKAFIVNRIGDFGFLVAMFLIFTHLGSLDFETVFTKAPAAFLPGGAAATAITLFLFLGCTGKSAQIPLYIWLPDAMQGPTPVSALIHAATMVTAGVYLVARCGVLFALSPLGSAVVAGIGALTALFAATIALKQWDIKRVLAYSTVSQLGYMFVGVGTGAYAAGMFHLVTHAFFKALLFLGSGSVIHAVHHAMHATHTHEDAQDMRNMGGLARYMPWTAALMWIATLAIAGIPPFAGFFSKDEILGAAFAEAAVRPLWYAFWGMGLAAALLTAFYMTRLMLYTFHGPNRTGEREREHLHEAPPVMTGPLVVL